jgi:hypothetical protein
MNDKQRTQSSSEDLDSPPIKKQKLVSNENAQLEISTEYVETQQQTQMLQKQAFLQPLSGRPPTYLNDAFISYYQVFVTFSIQTNKQTKRKLDIL